MDFVAAMMPGEPDPSGWVRRREREGWSGVSFGDHIAPGGQSFQHHWVTLTQLAMTSASLRVMSGFTNSMTCPPAQFAQAALTLQAVSNGRFEAGLGAGWAATDSSAQGVAFPDPPERARRYREAAVVAGELLRTGRCTFRGEFLHVEINDIGVQADPPPPLVVSVGGRWAIEHIAPLADIVEVNPFAAVFRSGRVDRRRWRDGSPSDLRDLVDLAHQANPTAPIALGVFAAAGTAEHVAPVREMFGQGRLAGMAGSPSEVAATLRGLQAIGISRVTVCPLLDGTVEALAAALFGPAA